MNSSRTVSPHAANNAFDRTLESIAALRAAVLGGAGQGERYAI